MVCPTVAADNQGGEVLPDPAKPDRYSLDDMANAMALFQPVGSFDGATQFGAEDTEIVVDRKATPVGADFLGGPVKPVPHPVRSWVFLSCNGKGERQA